MGLWSDALRSGLEKRAPELLQSLKDDKAGIKKLTATRRQSAMALLRKVMTQAQISAALADVVPATVPSKKPKAK